MSGAPVIAPPPHIERPIKRIMLGMMLALQRVTLVGAPAPITVRLRDLMRNPQPGDLVIESSIAPWLLYRDPEFLDSRWDGQFLTYSGTVREYREVEGETVVDTFLECLNPDGTTFSWTNAELLAVPSGLVDTHLSPVDNYQHKG